VGDLVSRWAGPLAGFSAEQRDVAICAAYLHDVIEDTSFTYEDLARENVDPAVITIVDILTKSPPDKPASPAYYARIVGDPIALLVKCADRSANLEDTIAEVPRSPEFVANYARKTRVDVLPLYEFSPLRGEIYDRLLALERCIAIHAGGVG
jgi:(p)ppGpp synthase/HD superfamily hydrolase